MIKQSITGTPASEVQKARTAQALRAFLHLLPPGEDCREPYGHWSQLTRWVKRLRDG